MVTAPLKAASVEFLPKRQMCSQLQGWEQGTRCNTQGTGGGESSDLYLPATCAALSACCVASSASFFPNPNMAALGPLSPQRMGR